MSRFVATPFVESNTQTVKVRQVQDQLKHIETRALDQTQDQQGLISKEISQPSPSGHPPATASGLLFYFYFFPLFFIIFYQQHRISYGQLRCTCLFSQIRQLQCSLLTLLLDTKMERKIYQCVFCKVLSTTFVTIML